MLSLFNAVGRGKQSNEAVSPWMPTICTLEQEPAIENASYSITTNKNKISDPAVPPRAGTQSSSAGKPTAGNSPPDPAEQQLPATGRSQASPVLLAK